MKSFEILWNLVGRDIPTQDAVPGNISEVKAVNHTACLSVSPKVFRPLVESIFY
jgi:hypothetical protein